MTTMPDVRGHASEEGYEDEEEDDEEEKAGVIRTVETFDIDDRGEVKVVAQQPRGLRQQACAVIRLSLPVVGQYILQFLNFSIPFLFLGRLSPEAMGAFALGQMFINCTANALGYGFVTALDTIASQAWGSKNFPLVGLATQRSVLIMTLFCFPFVGIWLFIPSRLFPIVGVSPSVTRLVSLHCSIMLVGIWPSFMYEIQKKYLANQGVTLPPVVVMIPALGLNLLCNWLLINRFGFIGAPISISVSAWTMCIMLFVYIRWSRLHVKTWPKGGFLNTGWDWKCLTGWYEMFKLGIPGALMLMLEWGIFEINSFFAARLGSVPLATHSVLSQTAGLLFMAPLGLSVAITTLVGNALGEGDARLARRLALVAYAMGFAWMLAQDLIVCFACRSVWPTLFTTDEDVINTVSQNLPWFFLFAIPDQVQSMFVGALRGMGKQMLGATINLVCYPVLGLPLSWYLSSHSLGVRGIWFGMTVGVGSAAAIFLGYTTFCVDWEKESAVAVARAGDGSKQLKARVGEVEFRAISSQEVDSVGEIDRMASPDPELVRVESIQTTSSRANLLGQETFSVNAEEHL